MKCIHPRRRFLVFVSLAPLAARAVAKEQIHVYKNVGCACCDEWAKHLRRAGFAVRVEEVHDLATYRARFGVPDELAGCHTARVAGYTIEGHVPAREVKRLLAERPQASGLSVPGMPVGSPGMETGDGRDPYEVILFGPGAQRRRYAGYE